MIIRQLTQAEIEALEETTLEEPITQEERIEALENAFLELSEVVLNG